MSNTKGEAEGPPADLSRATACTELGAVVSLSAAQPSEA
jgi:hypothetical protein